MFKHKSLLSLFLATVFIISVSLTPQAQGQVTFEWDVPVDVPGIQPLEIRVAGIETRFEPDGTIVHVAVVDINPEGGTRLRFCNIFPYVASPFNSPPPQDEVDEFCGDAVIPESMVFGLDGIVGVPGEDANAIVACINNRPTFLTSKDWKTIDKKTVVADRPCGGTSIALDFDKLFMYVAMRDTETQSVPVFRSGDGGDTWQPFAEVVGEEGPIVGAGNGGMRPDIAVSPIGPTFCVFATEAVDVGPKGLEWLQFCLDELGDPLFTEQIDTGTFPGKKFAESRSITLEDGSIVNVFYFEDTDTVTLTKKQDPDAIFSVAFADLGSGPPNTDVFSFGGIEDPNLSGNVIVTWAGDNHVVYDCETGEVFIRSPYPVPPSSNGISASDAGGPATILDNDNLETADIGSWNVASGDSMIVTKLVRITPTGGGSSSCAIAGNPVQLSTALANVIIPLVLVAFAFGVRAVRKRMSSHRKPAQV